MGRVSKRKNAGNGQIKTTGNSKGQSIRTYKAGIYARLSADIDDKKNESIEVQVEIARKFMEKWNEKHPDKIEEAGCYTDLGKTGTNFNRDEFQLLMQDIRMGDIDCVIVKDLSRFCRNYLEAGNYIEKIFPFLGVRFISVSDGFDTGADGNGTKQMLFEIKNLINDMYAKEVSQKAKISHDQRRKEGSYVGGPAPYGYKAVWDGKVRRLAPDENTAAIVRYIYEKYIETETYTAVADDLNLQRINPPSVYQKTGKVYFQKENGFKGWDKSAVERIIRSGTYSGKLIQGKSTITARDESTRIHKPEEEWIVKEEAHEALVVPELAEAAEAIRMKDKERIKQQRHPSRECPLEENIFNKVLYCGICGRKMTRHSYVKYYADGSKGRLEVYFCGNSKTTKNDYSHSSNRITRIILKDILFTLFEKEIAAGLGNRKKYVSQAEEVIRQKKLELNRKIQSVVQAKARLAEEESGKYMAYYTKKISGEDYAAYREGKEERERELEQQEESLRKQKENLEQKGKNYLKAVRAWVKWKDEKIFTKDLIEALIERIYIYPEKRVEVIFACKDIFESGEMIWKKKGK